MHTAVRHYADLRTIEARKLPKRLGRVRSSRFGIVAFRRRQNVRRSDTENDHPLGHVVMEKSRTPPGPLFLQTGLSMSDGTLDLLRYVESTRSSRPSMRRIVGSSSLSHFSQSRTRGL